MNEYLITIKVAVSNDASFFEVEGNPLEDLKNQISDLMYEVGDEVNVEDMEVIFA